VKRKFRDSKTVFTPSIQGLIEFIEQHPNTPASKLPKLYINIDTEKQQPAKLEMTEAEIAAAAAEAAAIAEASEAASTEAAAVAPAPDAAASTEATPKLELSEDEQKQLNQLMLDLRWLIVEGYVTEYGDGRLFAAPPMPEAKLKQAKAPVSKKALSEDAPEAANAEPQAVEEAKVEPKAEPQVSEKAEVESVAEESKAEPQPDVPEATPEVPADEGTDAVKPKA
jgi:hypothetical protein